MKDNPNTELNAQLQRYIAERTAINGGGATSMAQLNEWIGEFMQGYNSRTMRDFSGYSPNSMSIIISVLWDEQSPVKLKRLNPDDFAELPMFRQLECLLHILAEKGSLKLTKTKALPPRVVKALYEVGAGEEMVISGLQKINKEIDSRTVMMLRAIMDIMRVVKVQKGIMTLTKSGEKLMKDRQLLLEHMVKCATTNYNQAYLDFFESDNIGSMGVGYSLILLSKYGDKERPYRFYAQKYFAAFPALLMEAQDNYSSKEEYGAYIYLARTWENLFYSMGLIDYKKSGSYLDEEVTITRCPIFEKLFEILPPR